MVASHPIKRSCILIAMIAALFLNQHADQNSTIEVVHCRYTLLLIHLYMYMYVIDMYLEPK